MTHTAGPGFDPIEAAKTRARAHGFDPNAFTLAVREYAEIRDLPLVAALSAVEWHWLNGDTAEASEAIRAQAEELATVEARMARHRNRPTGGELAAAGIVGIGVGLAGTLTLWLAYYAARGFAALWDAGLQAGGYRLTFVVGAVAGFVIVTVDVYRNGTSPRRGRR